MVVIAVLTWYWNRHLYTTTEFVAIYVGIGVAGGLCESTAIAWYEFYEYRLDRWLLPMRFMPMEVCIIWPQVILGVRRLLRTSIDKWQLVLLGSVEIFFQALFIEICNVKAGLWHWSRQNIYGVPIIGVLGWAVFGGTVLWFLESEGWKRLVRKSKTGWLMALLTLCPATMMTVHGSLFVSWNYLGLREISEMSEFSERSCAITAVIVVIFVVLPSWYVLHKRTKFRIIPSEEIPRMLAAAVLMWLLVHSQPSLDLLVFSNIMAMPFLFQVIMGAAESVRLMSQRHHHKAQKA